jgi:hypothetical protein
LLELNTQEVIVEEDEDFPLETVEVESDEEDDATEDLERTMRKLKKMQNASKGEISLHFRCNCRQDWKPQNLLHLGDQRGILGQNLQLKEFLKYLMISFEIIY